MRQTILFMLAVAITSLAFAQGKGNSKNKPNNNDKFSPWDQTVPGQIYYSEGNVGIGTATPGNMLDVAGSIGGQQYISVTKDGNTLVALHGEDFGYIEGRNSSFENKFVISSNGVTYFNGGKVGIGTDTPEKLLDINGDLQVRQDLTVTGGADITGNVVSQGDVQSAGSLRAIDGTVYAANVNISGGGYFAKDANQKIGIGTDAPSEKLEVNGNAKVDGRIGTKGVFIDSNPTHTPNWGLLGVGRDYGNDRRSFCVAVSHDTYADEFISIKLTDNDSVDRFYNTIRPNLQFIGFKDKNRREIFKISHSNEGGEEFTFLHMPKSKSRIVLGDYGEYLLDEGHQFVVKDGSAMIEKAIYTNGQIGIGTTDTQGYELAVAGKIITEGVKVRLQTQWPDYVFKDNYTLPSLEEVASHIEQKGHLINIPSAKDVKENGIFLGEMNAKLLEKIEELTLYTIAQEKKIDKQEAMNKELMERLTTLEALLLTKE